MLLRYYLYRVVFEPTSEMASREMIRRAALTCNNTKIPPKANARAFAPFLTKTPAQMPHTVPNVSSYMLTADSEGGGRGARSGVPNPAVDWSFEGVVVPAISSSQPNIR
jgi:hypothetical protein